MEGVKRNPDLNVDDLQSDFDYQSETERKKRRRTDFLEKEHLEEDKPGRDEAKHWFQEEHGRVHRQMSRLMAMDAYSRHKEMINLYYLSYPGATKLLQRNTSTDRTDYDVLKDNHKFLWSEKEEAAASSNWETRMAKKYYDKLFKEYCIVDLTYFKKNKVAMRWRVEKEVKNGKGQFICGNKKCNYSEDLTSWEVNFGYDEAGLRKNALVKVRLCCQCSEMLNYGSQKKKVEKRKRRRWIKEINTGLPEPKVSSDNNEQEESTSSKATSSTEDVWTEPVQEITRTVDEDIDDFLNELFE